MVGLSDSGLYDAYFGEVEQALGKDVYKRVHSRILAVLTVSDPPLPLDVIADATGLGMEDVYLGALDLGDCLVSMRFQDERLPSLAVGHVELKNYLIGKRVSIDAGHVLLGRYVLSRCARGSDNTLDSASEALRESERLATWIGGPALRHIAYGASSEELRAIAEDSIGTPIVPNSQRTIVRIMRAIGARSDLSGYAARGLAADRVIDAVESCVTPEREAIAGKGLRSLRLSLHWSAVSWHLDADPERARVLLDQAVVLKLVAGVGEEVEAADLEGTAAHRWKQYGACRGVGRATEASAHIRDSLRLRRIQLEVSDDRARPHVLNALVICASELLLNTHVVDPDERRDVAGYLLASLGELELIHPPDAHAADQRSWHRSRALRACAIEMPASSERLEKFILVNLTNFDDSVSRQISHSRGDHNLRYYRITNQIAMCRCLLRLGGHNVDVRRISQAAMIEISELKRLFPRSVPHHIASSNLRRIQACGHAQEGAFERSRDIIVEDRRELLSCPVALDVWIQHRVNMVEEDIKTLEAGSIPTSYQMGVAVYDDDRQTAIGFWTIGQVSWEWNELEWDVRASSDEHGVCLGLGEYECTFFHTHRELRAEGDHHLDISRVELCCDGVSMAVDEHLGRTGYYNDANAFSLHVREPIRGTRVSIRARVRGAPGSNGKVVFGPAAT